MHYLRQPADTENALPFFKASDKIETYKIKYFSQAELKQWIPRGNQSQKGRCVGYTLACIYFWLKNPEYYLKISEKQSAVDRLSQNDYYFHAEHIQKVYSEHHKFFHAEADISIKKDIKLFLKKNDAFHLFTLLLSLTAVALNFILFSGNITITFFIFIANFLISKLSSSFKKKDYYSNCNNDALKETALCFGVNLKNQTVFKISDIDRQKIILQCIENIKKNEGPSLLSIISKKNTSTENKEWSHVISVKWEKIENKYTFFLYDPNYGKYFIKEEYFAGFIDKLFSENEKYYGLQSKYQPAEYICVMQASSAEKENTILLPRENFISKENSISEDQRFIELIIDNTFKSIKEHLKNIKSQNISESKEVNKDNVLNIMKKYANQLEEIGGKLQYSLWKFQTLLENTKEDDEALSEAAKKNIKPIKRCLKKWHIAVEYAHEICEQLSESENIKNFDMQYKFVLSYAKNESIDFNYFFDYMKENIHPFIEEGQKELYEPEKFIQDNYLIIIQLLDAENKISLQKICAGYTSLKLEKLWGIKNLRIVIREMFTDYNNFIEKLGPRFLKEYIEEFIAKSGEKKVQKLIQLLKNKNETKDEDEAILLLKIEFMNIINRYDAESIKKLLTTNIDELNAMKNLMD